MMRVLITGAAGSLGSAITKRLYEKGIDYYPIDINPVDFNGNEMVQIDLVNNFNGLFEASNEYNPTHVIHLAATIYGVAGFNDNDYNILADDITMTKNVIDATPIDAKLIYLSSSMVYEKAILPWPNNEVAEGFVDQFPAPATGYGLSKYVGEKMVKAAFDDQYRNHYTIWRPFNIITPTEDAMDELGYAHVFADYVRNIVKLKLNPLPIIGDGSQIRCFTHISEVADCIVDNLDNPDTDSEIFNIGNSEPITMLELANMIYKKAAALGLIDGSKSLECVTAKDYPRDVKVRIPNVNKARNVLGFEAKIKVSESIDEILENINKNVH
jgi:UDP-glucose 4-epimerase